MFWNRLKRLMTVLLLLAFILVFLVASGVFPSITMSPNDVDPYLKYGSAVTMFIYFIRVVTLVPLPLIFSNFMGIIFGNTHPDPPKFSKLLLGPICFRVVTRGTYPELVKRNVKRNIEVCNKVGLNNFLFEIITDKCISVGESFHLKEIVVPSTYKTSKGTMYKARALQYSLEDGVTQIRDNDWVVHLDEETLLTESSLSGIIDFIDAGKYDFGQGVITYANDAVVSWVTTMADFLRVGNDYGLITFTLGILHRPVFSWKGSFIVARVAAEKRVTFDFGPEGSIAEDCFFALLAWKSGYKFGFIEGEMWEQSTFSMADYIRQRKRWIQGISFAIRSKEIPLRYKGGISIMMLSWLVLPITCLNLVVVPLFPVPFHPLVNCLFGFGTGVTMFMFFLGALKSCPPGRHGLCKSMCICLCCGLAVPLAAIMETFSVVLAFWSMNKLHFDIVRKDNLVTYVV